MSRCCSQRHLLGRTITGFDARPFPDGRGRRAHNPVMWLDDGSYLVFTVEETNVGEYGVCVTKHRQPVRR